MLIFLPARIFLLRINQKTQKHLFETNNVLNLLIIYFGETPVYEKIIEHN